MHLRISDKDGAPIYQQIVEQVKYLVAAGRLRPGDDVPPSGPWRSNCASIPTQWRALYWKLEQDGIVTMRQGFGTTVAQVKTVLARKEKLRILAEPADVLLTRDATVGRQPWGSSGTVARAGTLPCQSASKI